MFRRSPENGNVLSAIESQGLGRRNASARNHPKLKPLPSGSEQRSLNDTSSRKSRREAGRKDSMRVLL